MNDMRTLALILAAAAASTLDWSATAHAAPARAGQEERLARISIRSVGTGSPVVLIPGLASSPAVFDQLAATIGKDHRLIFVHVNGFAGSPAGPSDQLIPGAVDELAGWLAANHIQQPAVIGHSMGGLMTMMLAKAHPQAVGRMMVVDALPFYGMLFGPQATPEVVRPMVEKMRAGMVSGAVPMTPPPGMTNNDAGKALVTQWLKASDPKIVGEALVEDATTDIRADLPGLKQPLTVVYAVQSAERAPMTKAIYAGAYKDAATAKLVPIENSEHFIMLDQPKAFADAVRDFLK
jgi:pimeloyl-ACP methyl ester carboxylesterase